MRSTNVRMQKRARQRGAAMVEGAFMALIMCLLWNLLVVCAGLYLSKLETVYVSKHHAFWWASHDCKQQPPAYKTPVFNPSTMANPDDTKQLDQQCPQNGQGGGSPDCGTFQGQGFGKDSLFAHTKTTASYQWSWQQPQWWAGALQGGTVYSESFVMCNEGPYGLKVWDFLGTVLSQAIGAITGGS